VEYKEKILSVQIKKKLFLYISLDML